MRSLVLLLCLVPGLAWAQSDKKSLEVTGNIAGLPGRSGVYLADVNEPTDTVAFAVAKDGNFVLKATVKEPGLHYLNFIETKKKALLFIGNDKVKVTGDITDMKSVKVTGSASHDDFMAFQNHFNPIFEQLNKSTQPQSGVTFTNADYEALEKKLDSFILANKDSYVSPFVIVVTSQLSEDMTIIERRYGALTKDVQEGYFGKYVKQLIDDSKIGQVGSSAIEFSQADTTGKPVA